MVRILESVKKSAAVTLTVVATMGIAARAQGPDPCDAASFSPKACQRAIHRRGYCEQGTWLPMSYPQHYPYYYDLYQNFVSNGGVVNGVPDETCRYSSGAVYGGFGFFGARHHSGS